MMRIIRRTQVTWETRRIVVTGLTPRNASAWCAACAAPTIWFDQAQAARWRNVPLRQVQSWLAAGYLHTIPPSTHSLLVCMNSLLQFEEES